MLKNASLYIFLVLLVLFIVPTQSTAECDKYVNQLINQIITKNITIIPLPSLLYSGFNTNNPGQKQQCLTAGYSYFLVYIKNTTIQMNTYTGICVPAQCKLEDVEIALQFLNCKVYEMQQSKPLDTWAIIGLVLFIFWLLLLIIVSVVSSFRQGDGKEQLLRNFEKSSERQNSSQHRSHMINQSEGSSQFQSIKKSGNDQVHGQWKFFNYHAGYTKIFKVSAQKNVIGLIYFISILSYVVTTEFSYRQLISENQKTSANSLKNFVGIFVCNNEIAVYTILFIMGLKLTQGIHKINGFKKIGRYFFDQLFKKWVYLVLVSLFSYGIISCLNYPLGKIWQLNYGKQCESILWQYWFLIRTFILDCGICMPWLWLLQVDIFLTLIAAPFLIFSRVKKTLTYALIGLMIVISTMMSILILDNQNVSYLPERLFNNQPEYSIDYNGNPLVRASPFFLGLMYGLVTIQGLEQQKKSTEKILAKIIQRSRDIQNGLLAIGFVGMLICYFLVLTILIPQRKLLDNQTPAYAYLIIVPFFFIVFLQIFLLPSYWHGKGTFTVLVNSLLGYPKWWHLDRIAQTFYVVGPIVIGFSVFNMQSSIYYDADTLISSLLGDLTMIYILSLLITAGVQNQISMLSSWIQMKIFGQDSKYSVVIVQQF